MTSLFDFTRKNNFLGLFARVMIKTLFPMKRQVAYFPKAIIQMIHSLIPHSIEKKKSIVSKELSIWWQVYCLCLRKRACIFERRRRSLQRLAIFFKRTLLLNFIFLFSWNTFSLIRFFVLFFFVFYSPNCKDIQNVNEFLWKLIINKSYYNFLEEASIENNQEDLNHCNNR